MESCGTTGIAVPDPMIAQLHDAEYLVDRLAKITGRTSSEVVERLATEHLSLGSNVAAEMTKRQLRPFVWSDELADFYSDTDAFLYETIVWNRTPQKNQMRRWIAEFLAHDFVKPVRVLTFGDGLGFDSVHLAQAGHQVDYFDVSSEAGEFARQLCADNNVSVRFLSDAEEVADEAYDVVVCLDVLEHVPDPAELVSSLTRAIRPGGRFVVHAQFWYIGPAVTTHLRANRRYSGNVRSLYQPFGLRPIDGQLFWNPLILERRSPDDQSPLRTLPARVRLGGWLLKFARFSNWPHRAVWYWMYRRRWSKWAELDELRLEVTRDR